MDTVSANDYLLHVLQMSRKDKYCFGVQGCLSGSKLEIARRGLQSEKRTWHGYRLLNRIRDRDDM